jgi:fucose 4-O-acetylase-like acetyltransferase
VDILNIIGIAIILMGLMCWLVAAPIRSRGESVGAAELTGGVPRGRYVFSAIAIAAVIALATPPLWTTHQPRWLPWYLESYINGVHNLGVPQPWLFPAFPWVAFAFAGLAFGFLVFSPWAGAHQVRAFAFTGVAGVFFVLLGQWFDARPRQLYAVYDFWHTSPNFFLIRTGVLLGIVFVAYAWCRWGFALKGFAPVIELGRTSLFVYWLHIEFVYGRFSILPKRSQSIASATAGILVIFAAMVAVAAIRNRAKRRGLGVLAFWRRPARVTAS